MHNVFDKARALGEAIQQSEEYQTMRQAEDAAMRDEAAALLMGEFIEHKNAVQDVLGEETPDADALAAHSAAMERIQGELNNMQAIADMTQARANFSNMMKQVNQVLQFMVTGEMAEPEEEGGCGGDCGGCSGCGHTH